jgi:hypothetical protein
MDRLAGMLNKQSLLQSSTYKNHIEFMTDEERVEFIRMNVLALTDELHEALAETGWKPWATSKHVNDEAYFGELVDAWHFLMNLMLAVGANPSDVATMLYERYTDKHNINIQRQVDGYDGVSTKCPGCGRALDDDAVKCFVYPLGADAWCDTNHKNIRLKG